MVRISSVGERLVPDPRGTLRPSEIVERKVQAVLGRRYIRPLCTLRRLYAGMVEPFNQWAKLFLILVLMLSLTGLASGQNPLKREVGPDGKPLVKAPDSPAQVHLDVLSDEQRAAILVWKDANPAPEPMGGWSTFFLSLAAALPALLAAVAAFIQGLKNGNKAAAIHEEMKALSASVPETK